MTSAKLMLEGIEGALGVRVKRVSPEHVSLSGRAKALGKDEKGALTPVD